MKPDRFNVNTSPLEYLYHSDAARSSSKFNPFLSPPSIYPCCDVVLYLYVSRIRQALVLYPFFMKFRMKLKNQRSDHMI